MLLALSSIGLRYYQDELNAELSEKLSRKQPDVFINFQYLMYVREVSENRKKLQIEL